MNPSSHPQVILESLLIERARRVARRMRTWRGYVATMEAALAASTMRVG